MERSGSGSCPSTKTPIPDYASLHPGYNRQQQRGNAMRLSASLGMISLLALAVSSADAATITGTVKGPDGAPFRGAFVQARNAKTKIMVNVLSDNQGRYRVENLPAGDYRVQIRAPGFQADTLNRDRKSTRLNSSHLGISY